MCFAGLALFLPFTVAADQLWQVNMDITLLGNNSCGGTCTQTIDASFLYDGQFDQFGDWVFGVVPGSVTIAGSGPLGSQFSILTNVTLNPYLQIFDSFPGGDELDIFRPSAGLTPVVPSFAGAGIYACTTAKCFNGFAVPGTDPSVQTPAGSIGYPFWVIQDETVSYTVKPVAEPATLTLLAGGLVALWAGRPRKLQAPA